jgi:pimeloyl-ACP methyl ester carboxylesterase
MKSRLLPRAAFLLVVLTLFIIGGILAFFQSWRSARLVDLYSASQIAATKNGPIEYIRHGDGPAVLVFHDAPGGYDQGAALAGFLADEGFQVIAPSRPGYLRTPLETGITPENQADAAAQLLDTLGIDQTSVLGFGWGGPAALEFARRFPQRTSALVFVGAAVGRLSPPTAPAVPFPQAVGEGLTGDVGSWLYARLAENNPAAALRAAFSISSIGSAAACESWSGLVLDNPDQLALFRALALSLSPISPRETGLRNDLLQVRALPEIPYKTITTPTLLIHGGLDKAIPVAPVETAKSQLPNSELLLFPDDGHLIFLGRGSSIAEERILTFLKKHTPSHGE